jgi:hypothetical protein
MIERTDRPFRQYSATISDAIRGGEASLGVMAVLDEVARAEDLDRIDEPAGVMNWSALNSILAKGKSGYAADEVSIWFSWRDFRVQVESSGKILVTEKYTSEQYVERRVGTLTEELQNAGDELRENHGDEVIADVIEEVEQLESEDSDVTARLLKEMTGL